MDNGTRVKDLTNRLSAALPPEYVEFLRAHRAMPVDLVVASNPDYWGVHTIFELADGNDDHQVDLIQQILWDVLPSGTLPIAEDEAGNLFLLDCNEGTSMGSVLWWDHERNLGEMQTERVASSFREFVNLLKSPS